MILAVGGWDFSLVSPFYYVHIETLIRTFSEADSTKDLFSLMISSSTTRATFISSVESALSEYGLDGIGEF